MPHKHEPEEDAGFQVNDEATMQALLDLLDNMERDERLRMIHTYMTREGLEGLIFGISRAIDLLHQRHQTADLRRALSFLQRVAEELNTPEALAIYHYWQGKFDREEGRLEAAIAHAEKAVAALSDEQARHDAMFELAQAFIQTGQLIKAEQWFHRLVEAAKRDDARGAAYGYLGLEEVARAREQHAEANHWLELAWQYAQKTNDLRLTAHILTEQGVIYAQTWDLTRAEQAYQELESFLQEHANQLAPDVLSRAQSALALNRANLARRTGKAGDARRFAAEALVKQSSLEGREQVENLAAAGDLLFFLGRDPAGKQHVHAALRLAQSTRYTNGLLMAGLSLTSIYAAEGYYESAHRVCAIAIEALERLRRQAGDEMSRLQYIETYEVLYLQMVVLCLLLTRLKHTPRYVQEALIYIERAKSRTMIEALGRTINDIRPVSVPAELLQHEKVVLDRLHTLEARLRAVTEKTAQLSLQQEYNRAQDEIDEVWSRIAALAPEYAAMRQGQPVSYQYIQQLLRV